MRLRTKINLMIILAVVLPPLIGNASVAWLGMAPLSGREGAITGLICLSFILPMIIGVNNKVKFIEEVLAQNYTNNRKQALQSIAYVEKFFLFSYVLYNIICPILAIFMYHDVSLHTQINIFLTMFPQMFFICLPIVLGFNYLLEKNTAKLGIEDLTPLNMKIKLFAITVFTPLGAGLLITYINLGQLANTTNATVYYNTIDKLIIGNIIVLIGALIIFLIVNRVMYKPLTEVLNLFKDLSHNKYTVTKKLPIIVKDEIGLLINYFNMYIERLSLIIDKIKSSSYSVENISNRIQDVSGGTNLCIKAINNDTTALSQSIENYASATEELIDIANNMTLLTQELSQSSTEVKDISKQSIGKAEEGKNKLDLVIENIKQIERSVKISTDNILDFSNKSKQISEIAATISQIAKQTNMLSLNAAIEAARAGESGKGFAVVADEIRKLSENTSKSIEMVNQIVQDINESMHKVVNQMTKSHSEIKKGTENILAMGQLLSEVIHSYIEISTQIDSFHEKVLNEVETVKTIEEYIRNVAVTAEQQVEKSLNINEVVQKKEDDVRMLAMSAYELNRIVHELSDVSRQINTK